MEPNRGYYILQYERTDAMHKAGDRIVNSADTLRIGQTEACEARLLNQSPYEDVVFAVIEPNADGQGWRLIRISPYYELRVNGTPVTLVHYLHHGDRISMEGQRQELLFQVRHDHLYNQRAGAVAMTRPVSRKLIVALVLLPLLLFGGLLAWQIASVRNDSLTDEMIADARTSIYKLRVDSIQLHHLSAEGDSLVGTFCYDDEVGHGIVGTAFLTTDSLLVTARHCIEPWLNDPEILTLDDYSQLKSQPTRWALEAETYNQLADDGTEMRLVTYCSLYQQDEVVTALGTVCSSDFQVNRDRDELIELGDFEHDYYWRSVAQRHQRRDMMLGDMAFLPYGKPGTIRLADSQNIGALTKRGKHLLFMGYPESQKISFETEDDRVRQPLAFSDEDHLPSEDIAHNGDIGHGFSGGPVLVRDGGDFYAVGIVSVTDGTNDKRRYSVPVTEIERMRVYDRRTDL